MKYLSVCSGIEAASVAWHGLGWEALGFSEIEPFPSAVLKQQYPNVTNFGDMTNFKDWDIKDAIDLIVGGTPCQSFSIAGLRKGLDDERGNLMLVYVRMLEHFKPKWFVWENVPSAAVESLLSDILETGDHLHKYSLSPKACTGILRRAEVRGKILPPMLKQALEHTAGTQSQER